MPLEGSTVRSTIKFLRAELRCFALKMHGTPFGMVGVPDIIVWIKGQCVFYEMKRPGEKPTKIQKFVHERIRRAGFPVVVAFSRDDVISDLQQRGLI